MRTESSSTTNCEATEGLVCDASRGDAAAIVELLQRYLPGLRRFLRLHAGRLLLARESCCDLVQSVCLDVLENVARFRHGGEAGFRRWLYATARRKIADRYEYYRAAKRNVEREEPTPSCPQTDLELQASYRCFYTPSQQAAAREELGCAKEAFARLPADQQQVILYAKVFGLRRAEIAKEMGRSEGAVRVLLCRALANLARCRSRKVRRPLSPRGRRKPNPAAACAVARELGDSAS